ncbi:MAG TPA: hypothetical protein VLF69_04705 [Candidatus Saccharimonadales bacterium]|nr:hypothetical protein [Candidatus Saccharimonadales bacterium]
MKKPKAKAARLSAAKRLPHAVRAKRRAVLRTVRAAHRRTYPLHKRMLLHPLGIFIMLCTGVLMVGWTYHALAATTISSTIEAPPLQEAATIDSPVGGTTFTTSPIHVSGTCPSRSYVALTVNSGFNGVSWCGQDNTYQITTSLYPGTNNLAVQAYNETDLPGPTADGVQVTYTPPTTSSSGGSSSQGGTGSTSTASTPGVNSVTKPILLTSDFQFHTFPAQQSFTWDLDLEGGTPPYDVNVSWGDGSSSHFRFPTDPVFTIRHTFATSGYYAVVVKSADTTGQQHIMQLAALITKKDGTASFLGSGTGGNSQSSTGSTSASQSDGPGGPGGPALDHDHHDHPGTSLFGTTDASTARWLLLAWPSYLVVILMTVSFWLGEKRELALVTIPVRKTTSHRRRH